MITTVSRYCFECRTIKTILPSLHSRAYVAKFVCYDCDPNSIEAKAYRIHQHLEQSKDVKPKQILLSSDLLKQKEYNG